MSHNLPPMSPPAPIQEPGVGELVSKYLNRTPDIAPSGAIRGAERTYDHFNAEAATLRAEEMMRSTQRMTPSPPNEDALAYRSLKDSEGRISLARHLDTMRSPYPQREISQRHDDRSTSELRSALRTKVDELQDTETTFTRDLELFRKQAEVEKRENTDLLANVHKLRAQLVAVEETKDTLEMEKKQAIQRREEECTRRILHMRKTLLLSEQCAGSLRSENESLVIKSQELELAKEELESLRRQMNQMSQNMTLLAQQNEALQRALRRKEADTQSDLDVYVKQLDIVQAQYDTTKKEMEVLLLKSRSQDKLQQDLDDLRCQNQELQAAINAIDKEATEQQEKHTLALQEKDEECAQEVLNQRRQIVLLERQIESLTLQNQHLVNQHRPSKITDEINSLVGQVHELQEQVSQKSRQAEALQRALGRHDEDIQKISDEHNKQLNEMQQRLTTTSGELRMEKQKNLRLEEDVKHLRERMEELRKESNTNEDELHDRIRELQSKLDSAIHRATTNENELETLRSLNITMQEQHRTSLELLKAQHTGELQNALQQKERQLHEALEHQSKQLEISTQVAASTRQDNAALAMEVAKLSGQLLELETAKARESTLRKQLAEREEENANDLATFNTQVESLTREINTARSERDEVRREAFRLNHELQESQRRLQAADVEGLESELQTLRDKVIDMNAVLIQQQKSSNQHIDQLQEQIDRMTEQLESAQKLSNNNKELELAVRNRSLVAENEKLKGYLHELMPEQFGALQLTVTGESFSHDDSEPFGSTIVSPNLHALTPKGVGSMAHFSPKAPLESHNSMVLAAGLAASFEADHLTDQRSQTAKARSTSQEPVVDVAHQAIIPPLDLPLVPGVIRQQPFNAQDTAVKVADESIDTMLLGHPIVFGNQPANSISFQTLPRMFEQAATIVGDAVAVRVERSGRSMDAECDEYTWRQYYLKSFQFAKALIAEDILPLQGVVLCGSNSYEWMTAFHGTIFAGAIPVTCQVQWGPRQCFRVAVESNAHIVVVDSIRSLQKFLALKEQLPRVKHIVLYKETVPPALKQLHGDYILPFESYIARSSHTSDESVALRGDNVMPEHGAAVVYTSGTIGDPKGVVLSHDNLCFTAHSIYSTLMHDQQFPTMLSLTPFADVHALVVDIVVPILFCVLKQSPCTLCIPRSHGSIGSSLRLAKPSFLMAPSYLVQDITNELRTAPKNESDAKLSSWASKVALESSKNRQNLVDVAPVKGVAMAQQVNERIRTAVGLSRCTFIVVVGGPAPPQLSEEIAQAGIDVLESYGLVECTGFATLSTPFHFRFGSAAIRVPGTEMRIDIQDRNEGEVLVRGRNVMIGYFGHQDLTLRTITADGWLRTGDSGKMDEMSFLFVTGRIREQFVTLGGEKVSPMQIESDLKRLCPALSNVVVVGDKRKYNVALVTLKCKKNPDTGNWTDELCGEALEVNPEVLTVTTARRDAKWLTHIANTVSSYNAQAPSNVYKVRRFCILSSDISGEELTPSRKVRRAAVMERCANIIEKLYADESPRSAK
jgi:long-chain-fatty-acid--CoA ligase ACSBG